MKTIVFFFAALVAASGQVTGHVWLDTFGGSQGAVVYPQYAWGVTTPAGSFNGFGFLEVAPHEPLFTNHLVVFTPKTMPWFSVHTETGGLPDKGLGFHQIGPRVNIQEAIPNLKGPFDHLFVVALPRFIGVQPNSLLVSGGTNRFAVTKSMQGSVEGFRRFFPHRPDYSEYWFLVHPKKNISFATFILQDGSRVSVGFGTRISFF